MNPIELRALIIFTLPVAIITPLIHSELSGIAPFSPFGSWLELLGITAALTIPYCAVIIGLFKVQSRKWLIGIFSTGIAGTATIFVVLGITLHRDFLSIPFPVTMAFFTLLTKRIERLFPHYIPILSMT